MRWCWGGRRNRSGGYAGAQVDQSCRNPKVHRLRQLRHTPQRLDIAGRDVVEHERLQGLRDGLLRQPAQTGLRAFQAVAGRIREGRQPYPIVAVVRTQKGGIGVGELYRTDAPRVDETQSEAQDETRHEVAGRERQVHESSSR